MSGYIRKGLKTGERHHRAKFSDATVRAIRAEHVPYVVGYETLAAKYGLGVSTVRDICTYRTRVTA